MPLSVLAQDETLGFRLLTVDEPSEPSDGRAGQRLAGGFGVFRTPVREAHWDLRKLSAR